MRSAKEFMTFYVLSCESSSFTILWLSVCCTLSGPFATAGSQDYIHILWNCGMGLQFKTTLWSGGLKVIVNSGNSSKLLWFGILKVLVTSLLNGNSGKLLWFGS